MTIVITAFERSPDGGLGLARDTRVRWALEEVGLPYEVRLVSLQAKQEPAHLRLHPFGLIPTYEEGELALFETGAIVFHIAEHHAGLFPNNASARARAITWMFAALNTVEPPILELVTAKFAEGDKPWAEVRLPLVKDRIRRPMGDQRRQSASWLTTFCIGSPSSRAWWRRTHLDARPGLFRFASCGTTRKEPSHAARRERSAWTAD
jgi:glutathione S-transferase